MTSTRTTAAANTTAAGAGIVTLVGMLRLDWTTGVVGYHDGVAGSFTFGGDTYNAVGDWARAEIVREAKGSRGFEVIVELSGIDPTDLALIQLREQFGRSAKLYLGFLNTSTFTLAADPELRLDGSIGRGNWQIDPPDENGTQLASIRLQLRPKTSRLKRGKPARATQEDQKRRHANDEFFDFLDVIERREVLWGGRVVAPARGGASPGGPDRQQHSRIVP